MPVPELEKFRTKYPQYADIKDTVLAEKLATKYPDAYGDLREKVKFQSFNPEGDGYDFQNAEKYNLTPDETGHYPSRVPETGLLLKGKNHPTFSKTLEAEKKLGYEVYKGKDGRYYSKIAGTTDKETDILSGAKNIAEGIKHLNTAFTFVDALEQPGKLTNQGISKIGSGDIGGGFLDIVEGVLSLGGIADAAIKEIPVVGQGLSNVLNSPFIAYEQGKRLIDAGLNKLGTSEEVKRLGLGEDTANKITRGLDIVNQLGVAYLTGKVVGGLKNKYKTPELKLIEESKNAESIRSNEGQIQERGTTGESGKSKGGKDLQQQASETTRNAQEQIRIENPDVPLGDQPSITKGYNPRTQQANITERYSKYYEANKKDFDDFRSNRVSHTQHKKAVIDYASKLTDEDVFNIKRGDSANSIKAGGKYLYAQERASSFVESFGKLAEAGASKEELTASLKNIEYGLDMVRKTEALYSEAGRTLESKRLYNSQEFVDNFRKYRDKIREIDPAMADKLDKIDSIEDPALKDKIGRWYYESILSSPLTDMANIIGNVGNLAWEVGTKSILQSPKTSIKMLIGIKKGFKQGIQEVKDIYHQRAALDSKFVETVNKYEIKAKTKTGKVFRTLLPTTRLSMEDALFRGIARGMETEIQNFRASKKFGTTIGNIEGTVKKLMAGEEIPNAKYFNDMVDYIDEYTDYLTFRSKLGKIGTKFESLSRESLLLKPIVPFVRTPVNIMKVGLDNSPLGFRRFLSKDINPFQRREFARRAIAGSAFYLGVGKLMSDGLVEVTGQLPKDEYERDLMEKLGYKPNHIYVKIGGDKVGVSYQNLNPINIGLGFIGNWSDNARFGKEDKTLTERFEKGFWGSVQTFSDQSFLSGISNLTRALVFENTNYFEGQAAGVIPNIVSAPKDIKSYVEQSKPRFEAEGIPNKIKRKIGDNEGLIPSISTFGEQRQSGYERFPFFPVTLNEKDPLLNFLRDKNLRVSPASKSTKVENRRFTDKELARYKEIRGRLITSSLRLKLKDLKRMSKEDAQKEIDKIEREANDAAKKKMGFKSKKQKLVI